MSTDSLEVQGSMQLVPAGAGWDAVKVPRFLALQALERLTGHGAVIVDPSERAFYFLVPPGSTADWLLPQTKPLGATAYVVVPPASKESGPGIYWLTSPRHGPMHTGVDELRAAIEEVLGPHQTGLAAT